MKLQMFCPSLRLLAGGHGSLSRARGCSFKVSAGVTYCFAISARCTCMTAVAIAIHPERRRQNAVGLLPSCRPIRRHNSEAVRDRTLVIKYTNRKSHTGVRVGP